MYYGQNANFLTFSDNLIKYLYDEVEINFPKACVHLIYLTLTNKINI